MTLMRTKLLIDGENFRKKLIGVLSLGKKEKIFLNDYNFKGLLDKVLENIPIEEIIFFFARLKKHPETREKSEQLIEEQRLLKTNLERQGFKVVLSGRVRAQKEQDFKGNETLVFKEKGVDVALAIKMVTLACDSDVDQIILGSSDSDLQPAVYELKKRGIKIIYLGFEDSPNKGLMYTTNRAILIRNSEIDNYKKTLF